MYQRYQKVLPESKNVGKSESNVAIEGHWRQLRVILELPKAKCHPNGAAMMHASKSITTHIRCLKANY